MYKIGLAILLSGFLSMNFGAKENSNYDKIYNRVYQALIALEDSVSFIKYGTPKAEDALEIIKNVLDDHPEIFYFDYENSTYYSRGKLEIKYKYPKEEIKEMSKELDNKINEIISENINDNMSDIEKVIAIHDYIVLNTEYVIYENAHDIYGVLVKGQGVCQGYAQSMKLLLNKVGIECIYVSSLEMNHAWNIVTIDGKTYHMDATWDDPISNRENTTSYKFLALSDEEMSKTHTWDREQYPECNSNEYEYMRNM